LPPATLGGNGIAVSPEFSFTTRDFGDVHVVALQGELDIVSAYRLALALVEGAGSTVVVDLSGLTFIDSSGISALVMASNRILPTDGASWCLRNPEGSSVKHGDRGS
jgi:anti-sigma B factor antagonist